MSPSTLSWSTPRAPIRATTGSTPRPASLGQYHRIAASAAAATTATTAMRAGLVSPTQPP